MTHATLSVQLKKLEEKGLVKRKQYESIPPCGRVFPDGNRSKIPSGYGSSSEMGRRIYRLYESQAERTRIDES